jgi:hypothetical protein
MIFNHTTRSLKDNNRFICTTLNWLLANCGELDADNRAFRPESYIARKDWSTIEHWQAVRNRVTDLMSPTDEYDSIIILSGHPWTFVIATSYTMKYSLTTEPVFYHHIRIDDEVLALQFKLAVM